MPRLACNFCPYLCHQNVSFDHPLWSENKLKLKPMNAFICNFKILKSFRTSHQHNIIQYDMLFCREFWHNILTIGHIFIARILLLTFILLSFSLNYTINQFTTETMNMGVIYNWYKADTPLTIIMLSCKNCDMNHNIFRNSSIIVKSILSTWALGLYILLVSIVLHEFY